MRRKSPSRGRFKSEAAEVDWYATPEGRRQTEREFERALRAGAVLRTERGKVAKSDPKLLATLIERARERTTRAISIRVPVADLDRAHQIAERTGVGYQSVLKQAIRNGLKRAG